MKIIKVKISDCYDDCREDIKRISNPLKGAGYSATPDQCKALWEIYSEKQAAGWLGLPEFDFEIVNCLMPYFEETEPDD